MLSTKELIKKYFSIFNTDYTQDANCLSALKMEIDEDPLTDSSGHGNTGALASAGNPDYATASPPAAYSVGYYDFDGSSCYIDVPISLYDEAYEGTIVFWLKAGSLESMLGHWDAVAYQWACLNYAGQINYYSNGSPSFDLYGPITINEWTHVACKWKVGTGAEIYVNGVLEDSSGNSGIVATGEYFTLGGPTIHDWAFLLGSMDEVGVFSRSLDITEINEIKNSGLSGGGAPPGPNPYPTSMLKRKLVSGYHCFLNQYILASVHGYDPLKLPDGTVF